MKDFLGEEANRTESNREENKITIRQGTGKSSFTQTKVANDGSRSRLGAEEVLLAEKRAAEEAIQRQDIPAGYQRYLKKYFEGIQPDPAREQRGEDR
jgi:hypothetical protein